MSTKDRVMGTALVKIVKSYLQYRVVKARILHGFTKVAFRVSPRFAWRFAWERHGLEIADA